MCVWSESVLASVLDLCRILIPNSHRLQAAAPKGKPMLEQSFKRIVSGQLQQTRQKASTGSPASEKPAGAPQAWSTGELQAGCILIGCSPKMALPASCSSPGFGVQVLESLGLHMQACGRRPCPRPTGDYGIRTCRQMLAQGLWKTLTPA